MNFVVKTWMDLGPLKAFPKALQPKVKELVVRTAIRVKNEARDTAPRDTGGLAEGLYVAAHSGHGGNRAMDRALELNPAAITKDEVLPLLPAPRSDYFARIGSVMGYWDIIEYGRRGVPAQPFIEPALRNGSVYFMDELVKIVELSTLQSGWSKTQSRLP